MEATRTTKEKTEEKSPRYIEAVGRRKTSTARVRLTPLASTKSITFIVNNIDVAEYFPTEEMRLIAHRALVGHGTFAVSVHVNGGGIHGQSEAISHAIARALVKNDETLRKEIKKAGFLKRDPRAKERRKFGLKKARKAPKWSKR